MKTKGSLMAAPRQMDDVPEPAFDRQCEAEQR